MYISDQYQIQWWLPPRTASRMTKSIITKLGFKTHRGHHSVFSDCEYDVYLNIRNPYGIVASIFHMKDPDTFISFEDYVIRNQGWFGNPENDYTMDFVDAIIKQNSSVKKLIRYENYRDDILSIDFIQENIHLLQEEMKDMNLGNQLWRQQTHLWHKRIPYNQLYTQETADIVYELKKKFFEFGGYEKDSWKTLTE